MRKTLTLSLAATALLAAGAAHAQMPERGQRGAAELTREAVQERATSQFERLDINDDGALSEADRDAARQARFARFDTDGNGMIDMSEFDSARENRKDMREERMAAREERRGPGIRERRMGRGPGDRGPGNGGPGIGGPGGERRVAEADIDNNGTVTQAEFLSAALTRFDRADADSDGKITREERRNARPDGRPEGRPDGRRAPRGFIG
ncbi:hypothetical protein GCM10009127_03730 [Alteraurantiacibacter aestuarii]|nr:EF-hand domain-containing protein [Alteraurantiacibacter aestuarii]